MQFKINSIWVCVIEDDDGTEGVPAINIDGQWLPLVAADEARLKSIKAMAQSIANDKGKPVKIMKFTNHRVETIISPA